MAKQYVFECKECGSHKVLVSLWAECDEEDGSYQLSEISMGSMTIPRSVGWCENCNKVIGQEFEIKFPEVPA